MEDRDSFSEEFLQKAAKASAEFDEEVKRLAQELKAKEEAKMKTKSSEKKAPPPPPPSPKASHNATASRRQPLDLSELPGAKLSRKFAKHLGEKPLARHSKEKTEVRN
jgi:hypothetical protein